MPKTEVLQADMFDKNHKVSHLKKISENTMVDHLGIEFLEIGDNFISAKMPVDHRTQQPLGSLHGGASLALAETLGSIASALLVDMNRFYCVGLEINANHVKSVKNGFVIGKATPIHVGRKTHVWDIKITNEKEELISISRLTVAVLEKKN